MKAITLVLAMIPFSFLQPVSARTPEDDARRPQTSQGDAARGQVPDRRFGPAAGSQRARAKMLWAQRRPEQTQGRPSEAARPGLAGGDPAMMVARMIEMFDKDGDQKLDAQELTSLLGFMRERGKASMAEGGPGAACDAQRRRKLLSGDSPAKPGGDKPSRPPTE